MLDLQNLDNPRRLCRKWPAMWLNDLLLCKVKAAHCNSSGNSSSFVLISLPQFLLEMAEHWGCGVGQIACLTRERELYSTNHKSNAHVLSRIACVMSMSSLYSMLTLCVITSVSKCQQSQVCSLAMTYLQQNHLGVSNVTYFQLMTCLRVLSKQRSDLYFTCICGSSTARLP